MGFLESALDAYDLFSASQPVLTAHTFRTGVRKVSLSRDK